MNKQHDLNRQAFPIHSLCVCVCVCVCDMSGLLTVCRYEKAAPFIICEL